MKHYACRRGCGRRCRWTSTRPSRAARNRRSVQYSRRIVLSVCTWPPVQSSDSPRSLPGSHCTSADADFRTLLAEHRNRLNNTRRSPWYAQPSPWLLQRAARSPGDMQSTIFSCFSPPQILYFLCIKKRRTQAKSPRTAVDWFDAMKKGRSYPMAVCRSQNRSHRHGCQAPFCNGTKRSADNITLYLYNISEDAAVVKQKSQDAGMDHLRTSCKCKAFRLNP